MNVNLKTFIQCLIYFFILSTAGSLVATGIVFHALGSNSFQFIETFSMAFVKFIPGGLVGTMMLFPFLLKKNNIKGRCKINKQ